MFAGTTDVDRKLLDAIERLGRALRAARQRMATDLGLTTLQIEILDRLDHLGPLPVGQLARELDVSQPTASDAIATLEGKELLERRCSTDDGRITTAHLTDTGQAAADKIRNGLSALHGEPNRSHHPIRDRPRSRPPGDPPPPTSRRHHHQPQLPQLPPLPTAHHRQPRSLPPAGHTNRTSRATRRLPRPQRHRPGSS